MRRVAAFAMTHANPTSSAAEDLATKVNERVSTWIKQKAAAPVDIVMGEQPLVLRDGRRAHLTHEHVVSSVGELRAWELEEPSQRGEFSTSCTVARHGTDVVFFCTLGVGRRSTVVAPMAFDARVPHVVSQVIDAGSAWRVGPTSVTVKPACFTGHSGAQQVASAIRDTGRTLPLVVVSEDGGFAVHPQLDVSLAKNIVGLANVILIDGEASWALTATMGKAWSCFNGAVRLYWPGAGQGDPLLHRVWTASRIMLDATDTEDAARRLCDSIRRIVFGTSAFAVSRPGQIDEIRAAARREEHARQRLAATTLEELNSLLEAADTENKELVREKQHLRDEVDRLRTDVANLRLMRDFGASEPAGEIEPETELPPATLAEAVDRARERFAGDLVFGDDVDEGVASVKETAGPPDKIFAYLEALASASRTKRGDGLGTTLLKWLNARNAIASDESSTTLNDAREMKRRSWHDGTGKRKFQYHLKPNDGTGPDYCVRIYFEWDDKVNKVVVGWVGRHP